MSFPLSPSSALLPLGSRAGTVQKGLISPQPGAPWGEVLDLTSSLVWKPSPLLSLFLKNELDLNVLGD